MFTSESINTSLPWSRYLEAYAVVNTLVCIPWLGLIVIMDHFACSGGIMHPETCEVDGITGLLGAAIFCIVHAALVALFAWTPASLRFRTPESETGPSLFNRMLYLSIAIDLITYSFVALFCTEMNNLVGIIQVLTISFNFPFLLAIPYLLAGYRDPSTDIGSFLHRVKSRICASSNCEHNRHLYEYSSLPEQATDPLADEAIRARLEHALFLAPRNHSTPQYRQSPSHSRSHSRFQSQSQTRAARDEEEGKLEGDERVRTRTFPRFILFVTAPNGNHSPQQPEP